MNAYAEQHLHFLARNRSAHRDPRNRAVHLAATVVGFCTLVSMLARLHLPGAPACNAGTLLAIVTFAYYLPFEPLATALVGAAWLGLRIALGPTYGQAGVGAPLGIGVPLAIFLVFNLTGVATHKLFDDPIIDDFATEPVWKRLLKTLHTILFSSVQFVTFALLDLGYRPALRARVLDATREYAGRRRGVAWANWGETASCTPECSCFPENERDLVAVVREAAAAGRRVRVVGAGHSWPNLCSTDDYLVFMARLNRVDVDLSVPDRPRVVVEAGASNREINDVLEAHGLALPFNVVLESVRVGGLVATGSHGSGHEYPTLSELVESLDLVTASGEIRHLSAETDGPEVMDAVRLHLGVFGVVWRMTLRVTTSFRVRRVDRIAPLDEVLRDIERLVTSTHALEIFLWPFSDRAWVRTQELTDAPRQARFRGARRTLGAHKTMAFLHRGIAWALLRFPGITPWVCRRTLFFIPMGDVVVDVIDAVHWRMAIEDVKVTCQEFSFKAGDDFENVGRACRAFLDRVDAWAARGKYPMNLTLNVRFVGEGTALLSPASGPGINCYIEMLSEHRTPGWREFAAEVALEWMKLPGARPHWAKEWEHIPGIVPYLRATYGERLARFLEIRDRLGVDPHRMFSNRLLDAVLFGDAPAPVLAAAAAEQDERDDPRVPSEACSIPSLEVSS